MVTEVWEDQAVWPNFSEVAAMLELSKATLSKQAQNGRIAFSVLGFGQGRHVVPPREVLRLSRVYRRAPLSVVQERLALYLSARTAVDAAILLNELRAVVDADSDGDTRYTRGDEPLSAPRWLLNVDYLTAHPEALAGTLSFVSLDEVQGMARLGGRLDDATLSARDGSLRADLPTR